MEIAIFWGLDSSDNAFPGESEYLRAVNLLITYSPLAKLIADFNHSELPYIQKSLLKGMRLWMISAVQYLCLEVEKAALTASRRVEG